MRTDELLLALDEQRQQLAANLSQKGVAASGNEGLEILVPKVLEIAGGGGSGEDGDYEYIYLAESNATKYFSVNLYDYVNDLDDIKFIYGQLSNNLGTCILWSQQLQDGLGSRAEKVCEKNRQTAINGYDYADKLWGGMILPTQQKRYDLLNRVLQTANNQSSYIGGIGMGYFSSTNRLYMMSGFYGYPEQYYWSSNMNNLTELSTSASSAYKFVTIAYKKGA